MRVKGSASPEILTLEKYLPVSGYVEVRLRENIKQVSEIDEFTELENNLYEYDEYTFLLKEKEGLREEIEANLTDWLITGRTLEVQESASIIQDMKEALEILGVKTNEN